MDVFAEKLQAELVADPAVHLAILYGSGARGALRSESDVDLAVQEENGLSVDRKMDLLSRIASVSGRPVDLVDLRATHGALLRNILREGVVLVNTAPSALLDLQLRLARETEDVQPYVRRTLRERAEAFAHGS